MTSAFLRRSLKSVPDRPRAVWAAFAASVVLTVLVAVLVLLPVLGLIGAAAAGTVGALAVPVLQITAAIVIGYLLAVLLIAGCIRCRNAAVAWILAVAAVISALLVSIWPIVAVTLSGIDQVQDFIPFVQGIFEAAFDR